MAHEKRQYTHSNLATPDQIEEFKQTWLSTLRKAPWMDLEEVRTTLLEENAILIPMYVVHYEGFNEQDRFCIRTHTTRNDDDQEKKPSANSIDNALKSIGLNYDKLMKMAVKDEKSKSAEFHNEYWTGHAPSSKDQPPLPELVKHLLDEKIKDLYSEAGQARVSRRRLKPGLSTQTPSKAPLTDWAILISLRVDRAFTNKDIVLSLNITCYDNASIEEGHWPIPEDEFEQFGEKSIKKLEQRFTGLVDHLFKSQMDKVDVDRKQIDYEPVLQDFQANKWLNLNHATLSPEGVVWNVSSN